jgi:hypothetical protein
MNNIQLSKEQLISSLKLAPNWEIRDANFGTVLASSENGIPLSDAIEDLQEKYSGYNLIIKAGKKDQNGKFGNGTKTLAFALPAQNSENEIEIIQLQNQNQTTGLNGFSLFGTPKQGTTANFQELLFTEKIKSLEGLLNMQVEKIQSENTKLIGEIENKYRAQLLDMRENQIAQKEAELYERERKVEEDEEDRVNRILPKGKNLLSGLLNIFLNDKSLSGITEKKETAKQSETEDEDVNYNDFEAINEENDTNIDILIEKLSTEQKELLLEKLSEDFETEPEDKNNPEPEITE